MVDLDRFKELNDTLGHHAGDLLLAQLGPRLQEVVGEAGLVARLGGDEFALLLPGAGLASATELVAARRHRAADAVRDRRARGRHGRVDRRRAVPGGRRRRRGAAAARRRRDVPGQGGAHGLSGLRRLARPPLARAAGADGRAAARARARRADPALPAEGRPADRARGRRRGARALAAPGPRPARARRLPPARRAHRADAPADAARARDRAVAAGRAGAPTGSTCTWRSTSPSRTCSTCAPRST